MFAEVLWKSDIYLFTIAENYDVAFAFDYYFVDNIAFVFDSFAIDSEYAVAILEAIVESCLAIVIAKLGFLCRDITFAPSVEHHGIDDSSSDEVHEYATSDDEHALPCWARAEFPRFYFGREHRSIGSFVGHTIDSAVASERYPTDTPFGSFGIFAPVAIREFAKRSGLHDRAAFFIGARYAKFVNRLAYVVR